MPGDIASGATHALYARALEESSAEALQRHRRKDGSELLSRLVVSRRTANDGTPIGYLLVSRDVTREQRRFEQERLLAETGLLLSSSLERGKILHGAMKLLVARLRRCLHRRPGRQPRGGRRDLEPEGGHRDSRQQALGAALERARIDRRRPHLAWAALETKQSHAALARDRRVPRLGRAERGA